MIPELFAVVRSVSLCLFLKSLPQVWLLLHSYFLQCA